ncbi:MAG: glycosyltransferase family 4 protein [Alphaproteobacteria bacterium]|nr:glycosyltransferase family 4 protein [Alphaproteobacteria bacterium]
MSRTIHLACPGPIDQPTGGYRYDAAIVRALRDGGRDVVVHALAGRHPLADNVARAAARACLTAAVGGVLVIDGLALPAFADLLPSSAPPVIALIHHPLALETGIDAATRRHFEAIEPCLARAAQGIVVTSPATVPAIRAMGVSIDRVAVVTPAVSRGAIPARRSRASTAVLCVASLTPRKGHRVLVAALARLTVRRWHLTCIGPTEYDATTTARVRMAIGLARLQRRVRLVGSRPSQAVREAYRRADLFVLPSCYEGYGMAFAEALAAGLPVMASGAGAVATTVPRGAGLLVRAGDAKALARALRRVLQHPLARRRLRQGAVSMARRFPDWPAQARRFAAAIDALAAPG